MPRAGGLLLLLAVGLLPGVGRGRVKDAPPGDTAAVSPEAARVAAPPPAVPSEAAPPLRPSSPSASHLSPALPLRRDDDAAVSGGGWRAAVLSVLVLTVAAAVALRRARGCVTRARARGRLGDGWLRFVAPHAAGPLRVKHSARLTNRATVHVVAWGDEEWLVGCTEQAVSVLGKRGATGEAATGGQGGAAPEPAPTSPRETVESGGSIP